MDLILICVPLKKGGNKKVFVLPQLNTGAWGAEMPFRAGGAGCMKR